MALLGAQFVNAVSPNPVGSLQAFAGASAPTGWLLCDGTSYSTTAFPELFSVLGYTYGGSSGNFTVPDLRGRMPIGAGNDGTAANNASRTRGNKGGDTRMPTHNHGVSDPGHYHGGLSYGGSGGGPPNNTASWTVGGASSGANSTFGLTGQTTTGVSVQNNGSGSGENMPPFLVINYIIKAVPDAPRSGLAYGSTPPIVTALPVNPQFGDVVTYVADATNGVAWNLQYDGSGTYPWKFVGGAALWAENTSGTTTTSSSYVTTNMPSLTVPLSGDYMMDFGGFVQKTSSTAGVADMRFGLYVNGVEKANTGESNTTQNDGGGTRRNYRVTGVVAGQSADIRIKSSSGATAYTAERTLVVTPIRVSA